MHLAIKKTDVDVTGFVLSSDAMIKNRGKLSGIWNDRAGNGGKFASVRPLLGGRSVGLENFERTMQHGKKAGNGGTFFVSLTLIAEEVPELLAW